jgi:hypothetical protein
MLRRYHDATRAVQRHQEANFGPSNEMMSSTSSNLQRDSTIGPYSDRDPKNPSGPAPDELPPPWVPNPEFSQPEEISEKERYRIAFEARERAAAGQQSAAPPPPATGPITSSPADYYTATGTPHPGINGSGPLGSTTGSGLPPPWQPTPPVAQSGLSPHLRARSPPVPPSNPALPSVPHMMSAAEEKALLKAKFEAEGQSVSSHPVSPQNQQEYHSSLRATPSPGKLSPTPPPLLPRPPASYIQETAEENARLQDELANGQLSSSADKTTIATASVLPSVTTTGADAFALGDDDTFELLRPTSPFMVGWELTPPHTAGAGVDAHTNGHGSSSPLSPPPLPPKVPLSH